MITSIILKFNNNNNPSQNPQRSPDPLLGGAIGDLPHQGVGAANPPGGDQKNSQAVGDFGCDLTWVYNVYNMVSPCLTMFITWFHHV